MISMEIIIEVAACRCIHKTDLVTALEISISFEILFVACSMYRSDDGVQN